MNNSIVLKSNFSKQGQFIYIIILVSLILGFISLPYLKTTISIKSQGLLQSSTEKADLNIPVNGIIKQINLKDNANITAKYTLLVIDANLPEQENSNITERVNLLNQNLADTYQLLKQNHATLNLTTNQYTASWQQYQQEASNALLAKQQNRSIYKIKDYFVKSAVG
ncbi:hypothetical protein [Pedobacter alpinus]|uniref:HlyD family secretion protein n=1 Tax=Pedobacter alpinus TaxID=1590643 RepID=A0ABW5TN23_9SPHI